MSEAIKFIIQELNKEPFSKKLNLISFDSLKPQQLLQILNDVFAELDAKMQANVKIEDPEQLAIKTLNFLRILKYRPPEGVPMTQFRQGIVTGDPATVHHVLEWVLRRLSDLRKRVYLARFLVKVELHPEVEGDADLVNLYSKYDMLIEQFKEVHKQNQALKSSGFSTAEIRKDIGHMEEEKQQLEKKIERIRRKVENHSKKDAMLQLARELREERDRSTTLAQHRMSQQNAMVQCEQKIQRLTHQLRDLRQSGMGATPEGLLQKLEEEVRANGYLVRDKLPKEISACQDAIRDMQKVAAEPAMGQHDLDKIKAKILAENTEINALYERKLKSQEAGDDRQTLFRQQAALIARKKESAAEKLNELRCQLNQLESELQDKKKQASALAGEEVLKGDEFKKYVNTLRGKSTSYKQYRQELAEMRAETGVLARTQDILQQKEKAVSNELDVIEEQKGVRGFHVAQSTLESVSFQKASLDEQKGRTLEDMSSMVQNINARIVEKKSSLAPIIRNLRPLRQKCQEVTVEYEEKKSTYDACAAGLESNLSRLEQEVAALKSEVSSGESQYHIIQHNLQILAAKEALLQKEMSLYAASDPQERNNSVRERLNRCIADQEKEGKMLRQKQKEVRENQGKMQAQVVMWTHLQQLLECKLACWERSQAAQQAAQEFSDRLVL